MSAPAQPTPTAPPAPPADAPPAPTAPPPTAEEAPQPPRYKDIRAWAGDDELAISILRFERRAAALGMKPYGPHDRPSLNDASKPAPAFFTVSTGR